MESEDKCELLANEILRLFSHTRILSSNVVAYIDATFLNPSIPAIETILQDDSNCERDSLTELLLFPDEAMQIQLEALLEKLQFQTPDEKTIVDFLLREPLRVCFRLPDERGSFSLDVPKPAVIQFISRLNITKHLNGKLRASIDRHVDVQQRNRSKVRLRNSRFLPTLAKVDFLCDFFEKIDRHTQDVLGCLDFALGFLDEIADDDIYQALMTKKKCYFQSFQKANQQDLQLKQSNLETLVLQGRRMVAIEPDDARKKMLMIDRISRAVFGRTESLDGLASAAEFRVIPSAEDMEGLIRIFRSD
jgi:hypothetical protein